jgi:hypothetical protein
VEASRRINEILNGGLPSEGHDRRLSDELAKLKAEQARERAWPDAKAAVFAAADNLLRGVRASPEDPDLAVLHNWLELALRAINSREGELFARMREFVNACDEDVGLGLVPLTRTGARRGGGSDAALARKLAALVERVIRDGRQAFENDLMEALGLPRTNGAAGVASRGDVALHLAVYLRERFSPGSALTGIADTIYASMPMDGDTRLPDRVGHFRKEPFREDAKATVVTAFRAMGFERASNLFAQNRMKKTRRAKRARGVV